MRFSLYPALILASLLMAGGCGEKSSIKATNSAPVIREINCMEVKTVPLKAEFNVSGRVKARLDAKVRPQVGGVLREQLFEEGNQVKSGQILYVIDDVSYVAAVKKAEAALLSAKESMELARLKNERIALLVKSNSVSKQDRDDAHFAYTGAKARVKQCEAELADAKINLERTRIRAPVDGVIGISQVTPGALVAVNQSEALATIRAMDSVWVDLPLNVTSYRKLQEMFLHQDAGKANVSLKLADGLPYESEGTLELSESFVSESTGAVMLRAAFANPKAMLLPGMFVTATITAPVVTEVVLLPQQALLWDARGQAYVYVVAEGSKVKRQDVVLDKTLDADWLVSEGLAGGETVAVSALNLLRPGLEIKPIPYQDPFVGSEVRP